MTDAETRRSTGSGMQQVGVTVGFCFVAAIAYLSRNCLGVFAASATFQEELGATQQELGVVMSSFFFSYALFQIPAGWLGQRFGSRIVLTGYAFAWSIATALMGFCQTVVMLCVVQALIGAAQAGVFPNAARSISDWLPAHRRAISCGFMAACMSIGGAVASALTGHLAGDGMPWQTIVMLYATPGIFWSVTFGVFFRNHPTPDSSDVPTSDNSNVATEPAQIDWSGLLTSRALWFVNGQQFFRAAGYIFFGTWFPKYLREVHGVSLADAGLLASLPLIAVVAGSSLGGILTDTLLKRTGSRTVARKYVAVVCLTTCGVLTISAMWAHSTTAAMTLITCGSFMAAVAGPCGYAQTIDLAGKDVPVVFGIMNMTGNFGAALCPVAVSLLTAALGSWELLLAFFCVIYLAAAVCWGLLDAEATVDGSVNSDLTSS